MTNPENPSLRVSDEERATVAERLRVATNEGRLRVDEYDDRLGRAYAATTRADLDPLTADLPEAARPGEEPRRERGGRKLLKEWGDWAGTSFVLITIWGIISLTSGELHFFWPAFPVGIWAAVLVAGTVFGFGSDGDADGDDDDDADSGAESRPR